MKRLAFALATVAAIGFSVPAFAYDGVNSSGRMQLAQADVKVRIGEPRHRHSTKKVIIRRDRGLHRHRGWAHSRHGGNRTVIIKKRGNGGMVKKKIIHRR
jgi:hypothetical protein